MLSATLPSPSPPCRAHRSGSDSSYTAPILPCPTPRWPVCTHGVDLYSHPGCYRAAAEAEEATQKVWKAAIDNCSRHARELAVRPPVLVYSYDGDTWATKAALEGGFRREESNFFRNILHAIALEESGDRWTEEACHGIKGVSKKLPVVEVVPEGMMAEGGEWGSEEECLPPSQMHGMSSPLRRSR